MYVNAACLFLFLYRWTQCEELVEAGLDSSTLRLCAAVCFQFFVDIVCNSDTAARPLCHSLLCRLYRQISVLMSFDELWPSHVT